MQTPPTKWTEVPEAVKLALKDFKEFRKHAAHGLPVLSQLTDVLGFRNGEINQYWGGPRPLSNILIGAGLGALTGYGAGALTEKFSPEGTFQKGEPRKRFGMMGAILGTIPGSYQAYQNFQDGGNIWDSWPYKKAADNNFPGFRGVGLFNPIIPGERFQNVVIRDELTPLNVRAATAGLIEAAQQVADRPVVSPWDIARVAMGTGSGAVSGMIAGRTLGLLAGLSPKAQKDLQEAGYWSGLLKATIPQALGFSR